jgi:hypothetical protein
VFGCLVYLGLSGDVRETATEVCFVVDVMFRVRRKATVMQKRDDVEMADYVEPTQSRRVIYLCVCQPTLFK